MDMSFDALGIPFSLICIPSLPHVSSLYAILKILNTNVDVELYLLCVYYISCTLLNTYYISNIVFIHYFTYTIPYKYII